MMMMMMMMRESGQNLVRERTVRDAESSGQSEVSQFDASTDVNEKILRLEITMNDAVAVTVGYAVQQLIQVTLHTEVKHQVSK